MSSQNSSGIEFSNLEPITMQRASSIAVTTQPILIPGHDVSDHSEANGNAEDSDSINLDDIDSPLVLRRQNAIIPEYP